MAEDETNKGKLPGNQGQFGAGDASEAYKPLEKPPGQAPSQTKDPAPSPEQPPAPDAKVQGQTNAGERS